MNSIRWRRAATLAAVLVVGASVPACNGNLVFATATTTGLEIGARADDTMTLVFGYDRAELASIPVAEKSDASPTHDAYSVFGSFDLKYTRYGDDSGIKLRQVMATGMAAQNAAKNPKFAAALANKAGRVAAGVATDVLLQETSPEEKGKP